MTIARLKSIIYKHKIYWTVIARYAINYVWFFIIWTELTRSARDQFIM